MRILANFTKKVNTGHFENETFTVTFEAITEFNQIEQVADYLFFQARQAVERQITGNINPVVSCQLPVASLPQAQSREPVGEPRAMSQEARGEHQEKKEEVPAEGKTEDKGEAREESKKEEAKAELPQPEPQPEPELVFFMTDKQRNMLFKLAQDAGFSQDEARDAIRGQAETLMGAQVRSLKEIPRKVASRMIDQLLKVKRQVA